MKLIAGIDIERRYTIEEIMSMFHKGKLKPIALQGYVVRADEDGTVGFIPYWESTLFRSEQGTIQQHVSDDYLDVLREDVEREHPITRSSPQEKTARMAIRIMAEARRSGITGLTSEQKAAILGKSWKEGEPLTGEDIHKLSQWFMGRAEVDNREADSRRVTRAHMTA